VVAGGAFHSASGIQSSVVGGNRNTASNYYTFVGGGRVNTASGCYAMIVGGHNNTASGCRAGIMGTNNVASCYHSYVIGVGITTDRQCTTFVNNLSIKNIPTSSAGLPSGAVWSNAGILTIVP
jgi:hypothetical protein